MLGSYNKVATICSPTCTRFMTLKQWYVTAARQQPSPFFLLYFCNQRAPHYCCISTKEMYVNGFQPTSLSLVFTTQQHRRLASSMYWKGRKDSTNLTLKLTYDRSNGFVRVAHFTERTQGVPLRARLQRWLRRSRAMSRNLGQPAACEPIKIEDVGIWRRPASPPSARRRPQSAYINPFAGKPIQLRASVHYLDLVVHMKLSRPPRSLALYILLLCLDGSTLPPLFPDPSRYIYGRS